MSMSLSIAVLLGAVVAGPGAGLADHAASPASPTELVAPRDDAARDPVGARRGATTGIVSTGWDDYLTRLRHMAGAPVQVALVAGERPLHR